MVLESSISVQSGRIGPKEEVKMTDAIVKKNESKGTRMTMCNQINQLKAKKMSVLVPYRPAPRRGMSFKNSSKGVSSKPSKEIEEPNRKLPFRFKNPNVKLSSGQAGPVHLIIKDNKFFALKVVSKSKITSVKQIVHLKS